MLGLWPTGLGLFANFFEVILAKPIGQTGAGFIDEIAFWTGVLTDAERLADWNGGAGVTYPNVPGKATPPNLATTVTLSANRTEATHYDDYIVTASVGGGALGGTVTFKEGATVLGSVAWVGNDPVSLTVGPFPIGDHDIIGYYSGSGLYQASQSAPLTLASVEVGTDGKYPDGPFQVDFATVADINTHGSGGTTGLLPKIDPAPVYQELTVAFNGYRLSKQVNPTYWTVEMLFNDGGGYVLYARDGGALQPDLVGTYSWVSGGGLTSHPPDAVTITHP